MEREDLKKAVTEACEKSKRGKHGKRVWIKDGRFVYYEVAGVEVDFDGDIIIIMNK